MTRFALSGMVVCMCAAFSACAGAYVSEAFKSVVLDPPRPAESVGGASGLDAVTAPAAEPTAFEAATQLAATATIRIDPVVGAPANAVQAMSQRIASRSDERGIGLVPPGSPGATHDMKGYFSAITESGRTTVIFVWDVFDTSGNRLHRIQGRETSAGTGPDGWSSVSPGMMESIGIRTVDELAQWLEIRKRN